MIHEVTFKTITKTIFQVINKRTFQKITIQLILKMTFKYTAWELSIISEIFHQLHVKWLLINCFLYI